MRYIFLMVLVFLLSGCVPVMPWLIANQTGFVAAGAAIGVVAGAEAVVGNGIALEKEWKKD